PLGTEYDRELATAFRQSLVDVGNFGGGYLKGGFPKVCIEEPSVTSSFR
ncbi:hypothetical protein A2U01_0074474, partial [Trifolium medium]|nr:hypothetical protein [Trifolium medium]